MPHYVVDKIIDALNTRRKSVNGANILIAGVAYKRRSTTSASHRRSTSWDCSTKKERGLHTRIRSSRRLRHVTGPEGTTCRRRSAAWTIGQYDCVVIITEHKSFDYEGLVAEADLIVDTRNAIKKPHAHVFRLGTPRPVGSSEKIPVT